MPKFKMPLSKELLQMVEVVFLLSSDTSCHIQVLHSSVYDIIIMHRGKVSCLLIVNCDRYLVI